MRALPAADSRFHISSFFVRQSVSRQLGSNALAVAFGFISRILMGQELRNDPEHKKFF
jgi:hypothetical protein